MSADSIAAKEPQERKLKLPHCGALMENSRGLSYAILPESGTNTAGQSQHLLGNP